jgi:hypothetical protein
LHIGSANNSIKLNFKEEDDGMVTKQVRPDYIRTVEDALHAMVQNNMVIEFIKNTKYLFFKKLLSPR